MGDGPFSLFILMTIKRAHLKSVVITDLGQKNVTSKQTLIHILITLPFCTIQNDTKKDKTAVFSLTNRNVRAARPRFPCLLPYITGGLKKKKLY